MKNERVNGLALMLVHKYIEPNVNEWVNKILGANAKKITSFTYTVFY